MIKNDEDYLIRRTYTNYGGRKMSADEMFKELGYEITTDNYVVEEKCIIYENKEKECIYFSLEDKEVGTYKEENLYKCGMFLSITMQDLQAINKKVEELGWNE